MMSLPRILLWQHIGRRKHEGYVPHPSARGPRRLLIGYLHFPSPFSRTSSSIKLRRDCIVRRMHYHCFIIPIDNTLLGKSRTFSVDASWTNPVANRQFSASPPGDSARIAADSWSNSLHSKEISQTIRSLNGVSARSRFATDVSILERVRELCDEAKYPIGSLIPQQNYVKAKTLFHTIIVKSNALLQRKYSGRFNQSKESLTNVPETCEKYSESDSIADAVNAALHLLLRICREPWSGAQNMFSEGAESGQCRQTSVQFCKPRYTNLLFNTWKNAALWNERVLSAIEMTQLLQRISSNSHLRYDFATIGMVLQVALQQTPKRIAPSVVQHIWDTLEKPEMFSTSISTVRGSKGVLYFYNALLKAHAESGNDVDDVLRFMYVLLDDMRDHRNISPDVVSFNILLRFIGRSNLHFEKFESAIRMMRVEKVQPDLATLFEAVYCCTKFEQLSRSEAYFQQMRDVLAACPTSDTKTLHRNRQSNVGLVSQASKGVMNLYLTLFRKYKTTVGRREIVDRAQALFLDSYRQNYVSVPTARTYN
jgi:hypothetical protein